MSQFPQLVLVSASPAMARNIAFSQARAHLRSRNNTDSIMRAMHGLKRTMSDHNADGAMTAAIAELDTIIRAATAILAAKNAAELAVCERDFCAIECSRSGRHYRSTATAIKKTAQLCGFMRLSFAAEAYEASQPGPVARSA